MSEPEATEATEADVPSAFVCAITLRVMEWPVVCDDGHSYEEAAICRWLELASTARSPMTNEPLRSTALLPNIALRHAIAEWREQQRQQRQIRQKLRRQIGSLRRDVAETQLWVGWRHHTRGAKDAAEWYRKAAENGNKKAQFWLGCMYYDGDGVAKDLALAALWYMRAGSDSETCSACSDAQLRLGHMYHTGAGVEQDSAVACAWYRRSAEQGNADAQYCMGTVCDAVEGDRAGAARWYEKAASQGHAGARFQLGMMCREADEADEADQCRLARPSGGSAEL